ncbi:hypothetical protein [Celeribacter indicus]|uniref:DUF998 domain-containing protein n=1 Tax=Celeribacter indicus TaxID=1208324 RepID=A0A0B5E7E0_9RHOB|nr:hypothetical protein [Celeribacter indicus]AJE48197.1 hypothetical protein P73_3482 [Celeribacter indicus]SDW69200.1 hypothetical protein SAMN05443573_10624 [Celeribacter indicus]
MPETAAVAADMVQSYLRVRRALGVVALLLPFALIAGGLATEGGLRDSVSDYFYSLLREVFTGALAAIGVFLLSYRGYRRLPGEMVSDRTLSALSGISALLIAFFPALQSCAAGIEACPAVLTLTQRLTSPVFSARVHNLSAIVFFLCLVVFTLVQFPKESSAVRPAIYRICGYGLIATLLAIVVAFVLGRWGGEAAAEVVARHNILFWGEAVAIWIFAIAWLTKGRADLALIDTLRAMRGQG